MPELPEVEVTRLSFGERIAGGRIGAARLGAALRWPLGCPPEALVGRRVQGVRRRGKYLLLDLDAGLLLVHLGMSGSLSFGSSLPPPGKHDHFELVTDRGTLRLHDPRRFGAVVLAASEADPVATKLLGKLGVEPLTEAFNATEFHRALQSRRGPIKQVLLAGDVVVGVGNIYASEALFLAGIRPTVKALRLTLPRVVRLHAAVQQVLAQAVAQGGSTLRDFKSAEGKNGYFQLTAMVYDREGEPCRHCGHPIQRLVQGQRASYFCRHCQH